MERPVPVLALAAAAGIAGVGPWWLAAAVFVLLLRDRRVRVAPILLVLLGGLLGAALADLEACRVERTAASGAWMDDEERAFEGVVSAPPVETRRGRRLDVRLTAPVAARVHLHLAGPCPPYRVGDLLRGRARFKAWSPPRNPGEFDLRRHRLVRGISGRGRVRAPPPVVGDALDGPGPLSRALGAVRTRIRAGIERSTGTPAARGLALALTLGERGALPDGLRDDFVRAGMAHLLAISGLHLALGALLVAGALRLLLRPFAHRIGPRGQVVLPHLAAAPLVVVQTLLAGAPPSCLRAATMILYLSTSRVINRRPDAATALALAALVNLVLRPAALHEAGFQLSFGATAAILWSLSRRADSGMPVKRIRPLAGLARVSLAAFLGTAPFVGWHFGAIPLAAPLVNLIAVPLASFTLLPGALLLGAWSAVSGAAAPVLGMAFGVAARVETWVAAAASELGVVVPLVRMDVLWLLPFCLGGLLLLRTGLRCPTAWALFASGALIMGLLLSAGPPGVTELWLLDVGEGNMSVLRLPCGRVLLLDGGPRGTGRRVLLPFLKHRGIRRVDDLVISHGHADHYAGALEVHEGLGAPRIISNGSPMIHDALDRLVPATARHEAVDCPGESIWDLCGVNFHILVPGAERDQHDFDENDRSMVIFLTTPAFTVLFTGDMGPTGWAAAAAKLPRRRVSLLQVPHHGHPSPHLSPLLSYVTPLFSFSFSDGSLRTGGDMGVRRIIESFSCRYHISGLHGPLHITTSFRTTLLEGGVTDDASP